jgi:hypothetical protein
MAGDERDDDEPPDDLTIEGLLRYLDPPKAPQQQEEPRDGDPRDADDQTR